MDRLANQATLAQVAAESGIAAPTLVQRYGSRRGLMLQVAKLTGMGVTDCFAAARAVHASPLDALLSALCECATATAPDPQILAHRIAFLHESLDDDEFRQVAAQQLTGLAREVRNLFDEACSWGELQACDQARLTASVLAAYHGALWIWAITPEGDVGDQVRAAVECAMMPFRIG